MRTPFQRASDPILIHKPWNRYLDVVEMTSLASNLVPADLSKERKSFTDFLNMDNIWTFCRSLF